MKIKSVILSLFSMIYFNSCMMKAGSMPSWIPQLVLVLGIALVLFFIKKYGNINFSSANKTKYGIICLTVGVILAVIAATVPLDPFNKYSQLEKEVISAYKLEFNKYILFLGLALCLIGGIFIASGVNTKSK